MIWTKKLVLLYIVFLFFISISFFLFFLSIPLHHIPFLYIFPLFLFLSSFLLFFIMPKILFLLLYIPSFSISPSHHPLCLFVDFPFSIYSSSYFTILLLPLFSLFLPFSVFRLFLSMSPFIYFFSLFRMPLYPLPLCWMSWRHKKSLRCQRRRWIRPNAAKSNNAAKSFKTFWIVMEQHALQNVTSGQCYKAFLM